MKKKFFLIFLTFICLITIGFKYFTQKNAFYSKDITKVQIKNTTSEKKSETIDEKLKEWQPGDIITFDHSEHIAIVSDKRRADGIPYIVHNAPPYAREGDEIMYWMPRITGHFRFTTVLLKY